MGLLSVVPAPYKWGAAAALLAGVWFHGWVTGISGEQEKAVAEQIEAALSASKVIIKQGEVTVKVVTEYVDRIKVVKEKAETIIKEVPVYVKVTDCPMSGGFRVLHDAAATNSVPDPATIADSPAAPAQDVAETVAANYAACHEIRERALAWERWAAEQKAVYDQFAKDRVK